MLAACKGARSIPASSLSKRKAAALQRTKRDKLESFNGYRPPLPFIIRMHGLSRLSLSSRTDPPAEILENPLFTIVIS
jgi:hypothetical protein